MSLSKLSQLKATMESLESYELPERFASTTMEQDDENAETVHRYKRARDEYIHRRMLQVFYDHVSCLEGGEFDFPQLPSLEEQAELQARQQQVQDELRQTAQHVHASNQELLQKYTAFCARRQELANMIQDLEQEHSTSLDEIMQDNDDDEDDVDPEAFTYQGQHLADTTQRKAELEMELARIRHEKQVALQGLQETKKQVEELEAKRGAIRSVSPETIEQLESETATMRKKVEELQEMSEWYGGLCQVMEEIGGIKLLGVEQGQEENDHLVANVQLLGSHKIQVTLSSRGSAFYVESAKFITPTLIKSSEKHSESSVQMNIPALEDLVRLAKNMGSVNDLRFLLAESMGRIRTITARVNELALLRTKFLTKIGTLQSSLYTFGGADQQVVCSLNEGITAVLRLSPDCPMINGSVFMDQLVGVGGWDLEILEKIKDRVNAQPCKSPVIMMEALAKELGRDSVSVPGTPSLPGRK
jgi:myosin heavy subunit